MSNSSEVRKILFIIPNLTFGGIQTQVVLLANYLAKNGFRITIIGLFSKDQKFIDNIQSSQIEVVYSPNEGKRIREYNRLIFFRKINFWIDLIKWLRSFRPTVILPYTSKIDLFINVVWRLSGAKLSFSFERGGHTNPEKESSSWMRSMRKLSAPVYVANSQHGALAMSIMRDIPLGKIKVIKNSLDLNRIQRSEPLPNFFKQINDKEFVFLMVANFFNEKDHIFLLKAWERASLKGAFLIIYGLGKGSECLQNFEKARTFIKREKLQNVILAGSRIPSKEVFVRANVGVISSVTEGCPNVVMEYMYFGLPVLSRRIPGVEELVSSSNVKLLSSIDSISDYAEKLLWCVENPENLTAIGKSNERKAKEEFVNEQMQLEYLEVFSEHRVL